MDDKNNEKPIDSIPPDINATAKEDATKAGAIESPTGETDEQKAAKKKKNRNKQARPRIERDESHRMNINKSFAESAKIIEDAVEGIDVTQQIPLALILQEEQLSAISEGDSEEKQPSESDTVRATAETIAIEQEISRENNRHIKKLRKKRQHGKLSRRQKINAILGMVMSFFIVIGVVSTIWFTAKTTGEIVNNTSKKEELARSIFPFVIIDISAFSDVAALDNTAIISSAIWQFIIDEQDKSKYQRDELGSIYVPDVDIEYYIRMMFGNDVIIRHQSVENSNVMMNYDPSTRMYNIESTPKLLPYRPRVDKIVKKDNIYTLKVSYILPDAMWNFEAGNKVEQVDKTMEYVLKKNKNSYQLLSVKLLSVTGLSSSHYINDNGMSSEYFPDYPIVSEFDEPVDPLPGDEFEPLPEGGGEPFSDGEGYDTPSDSIDPAIDENTPIE